MGYLNLLRAQARSGGLLDNAQLELVYAILQQCAAGNCPGTDSDSEAGAEDRLDYDEFCRVRPHCCPVKPGCALRQARAKILRRSKSMDFG